MLAINLHRMAKVALVFLLLSVSLVLTRGAHSEMRNFELVSVGSDGSPSNNDSFSPTLSADGRYIAFMSWDTSWFPEDGNNALCLPTTNCMDVFMRDRLTGETRKVSFAYDGTMATDDSGEPSMSFDGSRLVFTSYATNLVPNDTNRQEFIRDGMDVFLYEWASNTNRRISLSASGEQLNGNSFGGVISGNGRYAFFVSEANNVIPGIEPDPISCFDPIIVGLRCGLIYRLDLDTGALEVLDANGIDGLPTNGIHVMGSADYSGRFLTFFSYATNLAPGAAGGGAYENVYLYDHQARRFTLVSQNADGVGGNATSGQTRISPDGQYVVFRSDASNLVEGDTNNRSDIFLYETATGHIRRVSMTQSGEQTNGLSREISICQEGRIISFASDADNVIPNDTNNARDVFFYDRLADQIRIVSQNENGELGNLDSHKGVVSPDCRGIAVSSEASNLTVGDNNGKRDIFWAEIVRPAFFLDSYLTALGAANAGDTLKYKIRVVNSGDETGTATLYVDIPAHMSYVPGSVSLGGSYNQALNRIEWSGTVVGGIDLLISYDVTIDPGLTAFTLIRSEGVISGEGLTGEMSHVVAVNATESVFAPVFAEMGGIWP